MLPLIGHNGDNHAQEALLHQFLAANAPLYKLIVEAETLGLEHYYIGAGCIAQTVWNYQSGLNLLHGISDFDFVYFDDSDLSAETEATIAKMVQNLVSQDVKIDVKNEARVHLWYPSRFGYEIPPYASLEAAIDTWPTTATAVGVRLRGGHFTVYAPFGLSDLFGQIIRPNKAQISRDIYENKTTKWTAKWPQLTVIAW